MHGRVAPISLDDSGVFSTDEARGRPGYGTHPEWPPAQQAEPHAGLRTPGSSTSPASSCALRQRLSPRSQPPQHKEMSSYSSAQHVPSSSSRPPRSPRQQQDLFGRMDQNADGVLTREEFDGRGEELLAQMLTEMGRVPSATSSARRGGGGFEHSGRGRSRSFLARGVSRGISAPREAVIGWMKEEIEAQRSCRTLPFTIIFWLTFIITQVSRRQVPLAYQMQNYVRERLMLGGETPFRRVHEDYFENVTRVALAGPEERRRLQQQEQLVQPGARSVTERQRARDRRLAAVGGGAAASAAARSNEATTDGSILDSVVNFETFFSWVNRAMIRLIWDDVELTPGRKFIADFNRVVGGLRMRQIRRSQEKCPGLDVLSDWYGLQCYAKGEESRASFGSNPYYQGFSSDDDDDYTYWLDIFQPEALTLEHSAFLEREEWLNTGTKEVYLESVLYNGQVALATYVKVHFTLDLSGQLRNEVTLKVLPTQVYISASTWVGDILLLILLLALGASELTRFQRALRSRKFKQEYMNIYGPLNMALFIIGICILCFFVYLAVVLKEFADDVASVQDPPANTTYTPGSMSWSARHQALDEVYDEARNIANLLMATEVITFWYTFVIVIKFFEGFHANPRLSVISETLKRSIPDLFHFLIIFIAVFGNFALGGYILFGHQVEAWSSPVWALNTSFRALMGDFSYREMYDVAPFQSQVWFWLYILLIFLIMLNMLLAIIMDVYCEVAQETKSQKTLFDTFKTMLNGLKLRAQASAMTPSNQAKEEKGSVKRRRSSATAIMANGMVDFEKILQQMERTDSEHVTVKMLTSLGCPAPLAEKLISISAAEPQASPKDAQYDPTHSLESSTHWAGDTSVDGDAHLQPFQRSASPRGGPPRMPTAEEIAELNTSVWAMVRTLERINAWSGGAQTGHSPTPTSMR